MTAENAMTPPENNRSMLQRRFGSDDPNLDIPDDALQSHILIATRGVMRSFDTNPVSFDLLQRLCALALCSPTKSDLQQRDIVIVDDAALKERILAPLTEGATGQPWLRDVPALLIFCGNNRRQRLWHQWRGKPFANDHLDAFFNASVDAGIALTAFVLAAEAQGLGACPISVIRNRAAEMSELLGLPQQGNRRSRGEVAQFACPPSTRVSGRRTGRGMPRHNSQAKHALAARRH